MHSEWRCDNCGDVPPFHAAKHIGAEIVDMVLHQTAPHQDRIPLWCPWPLLPGWTVGHVLTHVARNADAYTNLLTWARTGVETPAYASPEAREALLRAFSEVRRPAVHR